MLLPSVSLTLVAQPQPSLCSWHISAGSLQPWKGAKIKWRLCLDLFVCVSGGTNSLYLSREEIPLFCQGLDRQQSGLCWTQQVYGHSNNQTCVPPLCLKCASICLRPAQMLQYTETHFVSLNSLLPNDKTWKCVSKTVAVIISSWAAGFIYSLYYWMLLLAQSSHIHDQDEEMMNVARVTN